MCRAKESSGESTAAIPPWARLVAVSTLAFLVMMVTDPKRAALMAKESPEMPLPITRKSVLYFMAIPLRSYGIKDVGQWRFQVNSLTAPGNVQ